MKLSIVTVSFNAAKTIEDTLASVASQTHNEVEHIVVDGGSTDGTAEIIKAHAEHITWWCSEKDGGIYDAMNKGLNAASGEAVGFLNADDLFCDTQALEKIARAFDASGTDAVGADLVITDPDDLSDIKRFYSTKTFRPWQLRFGHMPPHPTLYVRRPLLLEVGGFDDSYKIGGDFDLMLKLFIEKKCTLTAIPETLVAMRAGGVSSEGLHSLKQINRDIYKACQKHSLWTHPALLYMRYFAKVFQLIKRPKKH